MKFFIALFFVVNNGQPYMLVSSNGYTTEKQCVEVAEKMYDELKATPNTQVMMGKCSEVAVSDKYTSYNPR